MRDVTRGRPNPPVGAAPNQCRAISSPDSVQYWEVAGHESAVTLWPKVQRRDSCSRRARDPGTIRRVGRRAAGSDTRCEEARQIARPPHAGGMRLRYEGSGRRAMVRVARAPKHSSVRKTPTTWRVNARINASLRSAAAGDCGAPQTLVGPAAGETAVQRRTMSTTATTLASLRQPPPPLATSRRSFRTTTRDASSPCSSKCRAASRSACCQVHRQAAREFHARGS